MSEYEDLDSGSLRQRPYISKRGRIAIVIIVVTLILSSFIIVGIEFGAPHKKVGYTQRVIGNPDTPEWKVYIDHNGEIISSFHDIPVWVNSSNGTVNVAVEIPAGTKYKISINSTLVLNPFGLEYKNGQVRTVGMDYPLAYGFIPQTWENSNVADPDTGYPGDSDPLDVFCT
jgi:hypothetical protein